MSDKINVAELIREQLEVREFEKAELEISGVNSEMFIRMLHAHMEKPDNEPIEEVVIENAQTLSKAIDSLLKSKYVVYEESSVQGLMDILTSIENYFTDFGLETRIAKELRLPYLKILKYFKTINQPVKIKDMSCPNEIYLSSYRKYLSENVRRIEQGLNPKSKPSDWGIDATCDRGEIEQLALEDSMRNLRSGIDFSERRGDLRYVYGTKTIGELNDELLTDIANSMVNKKRQKLVEQIEELEGITEYELSEEDLLVHDIIQRAKKNRGLIK